MHYSLMIKVYIFVMRKLNKRLKDGSRINIQETSGQGSTESAPPSPLSCPQTIAHLCDFDSSDTNSLRGSVLANL